tara:strand:+ start:7862 stop:9922 length:2061 start_codon:yes stop_codon:yes gene_type:complete
MDYDKFCRSEAPAIMPFLQILKKKVKSLKFATSETELLDFIKEGCDTVALSVLSTLELKYILNTAIKIKKTCPEIVTILGGKGVSGHASSLINAMGIDMVIEGECEILLPIVIDNLKGLKKDGLIEPFSEKVKLKDEEIEYFSNKLKPILEKKVFYRSPIPSKVGNKIVTAQFIRKINFEGKMLNLHIPINGVFIKTFEGTIVNTKLDYKGLYNSWKEKIKMPFNIFLKQLMPYPTEEELNTLMQEYPWDIVTKKGYKAISIYAQRGCNWGKCSYCSISTPFGRRLSPYRIVGWLDEAIKQGITHVTFEDDQFIQNYRWIKNLCTLILEHDLDKHIQFGAMISVDSVKDIEILKMLKKCNFIKLQIGAESLIPEKIKYFKKTVEGNEEKYVLKIKKIINQCLEIGIHPGMFIITSRPKKRGGLVEVAEELKAITKLIYDAYSRFSLLPTISFNNMLMAYPGAPLFEIEDYKKIVIPLGITRVRNKIVINKLTIPYIFEFKSIDLANFIGNLLEISKRRMISPEVLNETLEHIEDLIQALEISAQQLTSDMGLALRIIESSNTNENEINGVLKGRIEPEYILNSVNLEDYKKVAEKEKKKIIETLSKANEYLKDTEIGIIKEVTTYIRITYKKLKHLENVKDKSFLIQLNNLRDETNHMLFRTHPYLKSRDELEVLINLINNLETRT